jgi:hypothetical protein
VRITLKKNLILAALVAFVVLSSINCEKSVDNSLTFKNLASGGIIINFKGTDYRVASGSTLRLTELDKGMYSYATTYEIPAGASGGTSQGDVSGTVTLNAGTHILVLYSSTVTAGTYTLYATISNSDDQTPEDDNNPTSP